MMRSMNVDIMIVVVISCLVFIMNPPSTQGKKTFGTATPFPTPDIPNGCFENKSHDLQLFAAKGSEAIWKAGAACGDIFMVGCIGSVPINKTSSFPCRREFSVVVELVDLCAPPTCTGTFCLERDAFSVIAQLNATCVISIQYRKLNI